MRYSNTFQILVSCRVGRPPDRLALNGKRVKILVSQLERVWVQVQLTSRDCKKSRHFALSIAEVDFRAQKYIMPIKKNL